MELKEVIDLLKKDKYAPFSATFNTIFPWIYYSIKPTDNFFGYYEERIVPELR